MTTYKEWRAVGIDVEDGRESYEERPWRGAKADARDDVAEMKRSSVPYDRIIVQRRKITLPVEVSS